MNMRDADRKPRWRLVRRLPRPTARYPMCQVARSEAGPDLG